MRTAIKSVFLLLLFGFLAACTPDTSISESGFDYTLNDHKTNNKGFHKSSANVTYQIDMQATITVTNSNGNNQVTNTSQTYQDIIGPEDLPFNLDIYGNATANDGTFVRANASVIVNKLVDGLVVDNLVDETLSENNCSFGGNVNIISSYSELDFVSESNIVPNVYWSCGVSNGGGGGDGPGGPGGV